VKVEWRNKICEISAICERFLQTLI